MELDRSELIRRAEEVEHIELCQYGIHKDYEKRTWQEDAICHHCSQFYCGIDNEELVEIAARIGIRADELVFGTEEERRGE